MKKITFLCSLVCLLAFACKQEKKAAVISNPLEAQMKNSYTEAMKSMAVVHDYQVEFRAKSRKLAEESNLQKLDPNVQMMLSELNKAEHLVAQWNQDYARVEVDTFKSATAREMFLGNGNIEIEAAKTQINKSIDLAKRVLAGENIVPNATKQ